MKFCENCGNQLNTDSAFCGKCGNAVSNVQVTQNNQINQQSGLECPHCHSHNVNVQVVSYQKGTGCITILFYILLAISLVGWLILIPLLASKKSFTKKTAVCQNCGYSFTPRIINSKAQTSQQKMLVIVLLIILALVIGFAVYTTI